MLSFRGLVRLTNLQWLLQSPTLIFASVCGALLGSAFNMLKRRVRFWRRRHPGVLWRLGEAAAAVALTAGTLLGLPALAGTCLRVCSWIRAPARRLGRKTVLACTPLYLL